jgi:mono/diheme cytochrome c family protein
MSLYVFLRDTDGESACYDQCATAWPPLLTDDAPVALDGVDGELLGTTERTDGTTQVTYAGWPLYFFVQDQAAGDVAGQGVNDVWYLVSPAGEAIGAEVAGGGDDGFEDLMVLGGRIFEQQCAACHGLEGNQSRVSHAAILDGFGRLNDTSRMLRAIVNGRGYMPGLGGALTDEEVAAVATYVRNSWSNDARSGERGGGGSGQVTACALRAHRTGDPHRRFPAHPTLSAPTPYLWRLYRMRTLRSSLLALAAAALVGAMSVGLAQTVDDLNNPPPGEWPQHGRDAAATRYSPLDQINTSNVSDLRLAWARDLDFRQSHQGTPTFWGGLLYVSTNTGVIALRWSDG